VNQAHRKAEITKAFHAHYWADEEPRWARDPFNADTACQCGDCGAWLEVVRPGKHQCGACDWLQLNTHNQEDL
jgi:hypothetical protein